MRLQEIQAFTLGWLLEFSCHIVVLYLFQLESWWQSVSINTSGTVWTLPKPAIFALLDSFQEETADLQSITRETKSHTVAKLAQVSGVLK